MTLVGVPGIGKSRLVTEPFQVVEQDSDLIWWRQGRSLPYGEGLSYWALGEIAKAQAGILETDRVDAAETKLQTTAKDVIPEPDEREWVEGHLRPLVGLTVAADSGGDRHGEAFAAWRRFLEAVPGGARGAASARTRIRGSALGRRRPADFVDHLAEWAAGVAMPIVCTARPELLDRRPGWGGGKRNAATVSISALSQEETAQLLASLLEQLLLPAGLQARVLAHAKGNPLYAEEYVRMLQDRGFLVRGARGCCRFQRRCRG
jgi:hypothetical protein